MRLSPEAATYCHSFEQQPRMNSMQGGKTQLVSCLETVSPNDIGFIRRVAASKTASANVHQQRKNVRSCQATLFCCHDISESGDGASVIQRYWQLEPGRKRTTRIKGFCFPGPLLLPLLPRCKDSPLPGFRGCAFEKRTGNELREVTKPISSFLCQTQALLLTQQVKSYLFGMAPEVPDIISIKKISFSSKARAVQLS